MEFKGRADIFTNFFQSSGAVMGCQFPAWRDCLIRSFVNLQ